MIFYPIEHRSEEWYSKRRGIPTASQFSRIITPGGKPSSQAPLYEAELIAERIFNAPMRRDVSQLPAVRHGIETEPEAAEVLSAVLGVNLEPGGFMTDESGRVGCSPDRLIYHGNRHELVEIKCPYEIPNHVRNLLFGPNDDYRAQIQGQLLISGYDRAHFLSYHPLCPPKYVPIDRDEGFIQSLSVVLKQFCDRLEVNYQRALAMGEWGSL